MENINDLLVSLSYKQRRYILCRMGMMDTQEADSLAGTTAAGRAQWKVNSPRYKELDDNIETLQRDYGDIALKWLKKENQLTAVLLEKKILDKIEQEIDKGEYDLVKTHLAREVFARHTEEIGKALQSVNITWAQIINSSVRPLKEREKIQALKSGLEVIEGEFKESNNGNGG